MYLALFLAAIVEGPIITVISGAGISLGYLIWWTAFIVIVIGDVVGDVGHYYIGRWGGEPFVKKWGKYIGIKDSHLAKVEKMLEDHTGRVLLLSKLAHGIGGAVLVAAGMVKIDLKKFVFWNALGAIPKTLGLLIIGFYFANAVTKIHSALDVVASVFIVLSIVLIFVWIYVYRKKSEKNSA